VVGDSYSGVLDGHGGGGAFIAGVDGAGMTDLNRFVSLANSNLTFCKALAINDLGQIVAQADNGHSYLLFPIPEPEIYALMPIRPASSWLHYSPQEANSIRNRTGLNLLCSICLLLLPGKHESSLLLMRFPIFSFFIQIIRCKQSNQVRPDGCASFLLWFHTGVKRPIHLNVTNCTQQPTGIRLH
jgi:hypothetical protein